MKRAAPTGRSTITDSRSYLGRWHSTPRRRHPRYRVRDVRGSFPLRTDADVLNMSLTGLAIESRRPLEVGRNYEFTLNTSATGVQLRADVQWCHLVRTERSGTEVAAIYQSGMDFRRMLDKKAQELLSLLQHHIVIEADRRSPSGFDVDFEVPATGTRCSGVPVKEITLCGMMVETDQMLDVGTILDLVMRPGNRAFRVAGRVIRTRQLSASREVGIAFETPDEPSEHALKELIIDFLAE